MKKILRKLIPENLIPFAENVYWRIFNAPPKLNIAKEQLSATTALKCFVSYNKYGGYCIPYSSCRRPAAHKILTNKVYEPKTIDFMTSNCGSGDIVHAGAYFGDFIPALSRECSPKAKVWAFEPNRENYRCAEITLLLNEIDNVELINAGLGNKKEQLRIITHDKNGHALGGASRIVQANPSSSERGAPVQIVTVDNTVGREREVSIIQLDVEGHEKEALSGAMKTIHRCRPILILEVLPNSTLLDSDWFADNILSLGYRMTHTVHSNSVFMCE